MKIGKLCKRMDHALPLTANVSSGILIPSAECCLAVSGVPVPRTLYITVAIEKEIELVLQNYKF